MLTYEQALNQIRQSLGTWQKGVETVQLKDALGRVLAGPIKAGFDLPRFNNSAVDGYGVLVEDLNSATESAPIKLQLAGQVAAGTKDDAQGEGYKLRPGQCLRILTGAPVPESVEAVVMKEFCRLEESADEKSPESIFIDCKTRIGENIRLQGEELEAGSNVLAQGMLVSPPIIGLLATLGQAEVSVFKQPHVSVISTGDELIDPGQPITGCQIYNSNTPALLGALQALGISKTSSHHALDDRDQTRQIFQTALAQSDLIISVGGVSVGERDYVKEVFEDLGVRTVFWRVAIKPGKPVYFGLVEKDQVVQKLIFGLPGNPVSALVTFNLFVKPALKIMQGLKEKSQRITMARLARNLKKKGGRLDFVRGTLESGEDGTLVAQATSGQESHMLTGLAAADCLMLFQADLEFLPEGSLLPVQLLNWHE